VKAHDRGTPTFDFSFVLVLHRQNQLAEAERACLRFLQEHPNHFDAQNLLGIMALQSRRYARAEDRLSAAIALSPGDDGGPTIGETNHANCR
jgi:Flp pilus assembly protein TadD